MALKATVRRVEHLASCLLWRGHEWADPFINLLKSVVDPDPEICGHFGFWIRKTRSGSYLFDKKNLYYFCKFVFVYIYNISLENL
jgi:hypothetical protein